MKVISSVVGAALLLAALILAYQSSKNGEAMKAGKEVIMTQYITASDKALAEGDFQGALKFAKQAIQFDSNSKDGFNQYEKIMELQYKPATVVKEEVKVEVVEPVKAEKTVTTTGKSTPKTVEKKKEIATPTAVQEAAPASEAPKKKASEEPMGC